MSEAQHLFQSPGYKLTVQTLDIQQTVRLKSYVLKIKNNFKIQEDKNSKN